jgi:glycosyltransferase involved in cell wall biosynthesis
MRRILIIAYYFPPAGGGGVQRTVKFVKYLPRFGWKPFVLTVCQRSYSTLDDDLTGDVPGDVKIFRTASLISRRRTDIFRRKSLKRRGGSPEAGNRPVRGIVNSLLWKIRDHVLIPDVQIEWLPFAVSAGLRVARRYHIDAIYTTGGPFSTFLAGYVLKRITGKPWVADFRDAWMQSSCREWESHFRKQLEGRLERLVVTSADKIVTVSRPMKTYFQKTYPELPSGRYEVIPNGFDPDDFQGVKAPEPKRFTICYTGRIGGRLYSPESFFHALSLFIEEDRRRKKDIEIIFSGVFEEDCRQLIGKYGLEDIIKIDGYIPHRGAIQRQRMAHVLLLLYTAARGGEEILTGKLLEYLNQGSFILALVSGETEAARLIHRTGSGLVIDPRDVPAIKQILTDLYRRYQEGKLFHKEVPEDILKGYSRVELTGRLARQMNEILQETVAPRG